MIILVDGYNVLKQIMPQQMVSESQRQEFIAQLRTYGKLKGHKIVLVFDAGPFDRPTKDHFEGIMVVYSGVKESADDYLRTMMDAYRMQDLMLITTDRALRTSAVRLHIESLPAIEFYQLLQQTLQTMQPSKSQQSQLTKTTESADKNLDELMMEIVQVPSKGDDILVGRKRQGPQISKQERETLKKIKKL